MSTTQSFGPEPPSGPEQLPTLTYEERMCLGELIDRYELAQDTGNKPSLEELCASSPKLLPHLLAALKRLRLLDERLSTLPTLTMPTQIGEFKAVEKIGTGASGIVFRCRQTAPDRDVAVKVLKPTLDVDDQRRLFEREMAVVSAINEEGMASVYQTGIVDWCGVRCLWIAMELLDGGTLCQYVQRHSVSVRQSLKLFRKVCETLRAAHRVGILHRDIKPSNILMSEDGQPHLVDFGVAKLPTTMPNVQHTETGCVSFQGTVAWMAPELLLAQPMTPGDVRAEIFSLGVVLFELLTGQHPFAVDRLSVTQISARITHNEHVSLQTLLPRSSRDLVAFTETMMACKADDRYQNLDELLRDLESLINGQPVRARRVAFPETVVRWCRRNWKVAVPLGIAFGAMVFVGITIVVTSEQLQQQAEVLTIANSELQTKKSVLEKQASELREAIRLRDRSVSNGLLHSLQSTANSAPWEVQQTLKNSDHFPDDMRGFAWRLLDHESTVDMRSLPNAGAPVVQLAFDSASRFLVATDELEHLSVYDISAGTRTVCSSSVLPLTRIGFRNENRTAIVVSADRRILEISMPDGTLVRQYSDLSGVGPRFALASDGNLLGGTSTDKNAFLLELNSGRVTKITTKLAAKTAGVWFSPDMTTLNLVDTDGQWQLWNIETQHLIRQKSLAETIPSLQSVHAVEFSPRMGADGNYIAIARTNAVISVLYADSGSVKNESIPLHGEQRPLLAFLPPYHLITIGSMVFLHSLHQAEPPRALPVAKDIGRAVAVSHDSKFIAIGGVDGSVSLLNTKKQDACETTYEIFKGMPDSGFGIPKSLLRLGNSNHFICGHTGGWIAHFNATSGELIEAFPISQGPVNDMAVDPGSRLLAIGTAGKDSCISVLAISADNRLSRVSEQSVTEVPLPEKKLIAKPEEVARINMDPDVRCVAFTDDGQSLLAALRNGELLVIGCSDWLTKSRWMLHEGGIFAMCIRGNICVTGGTDGFICLTDISIGQRVGGWSAHLSRITDLIPNADGTMIFSASMDGDIAVWNRSGKRLHSLIGHVGPVKCLALTEDGSTLVSGGDDHRIILWDAVTGDLQLEINAHADHLADLEFVSNDRGLLSCSLDGQSKLWSDGSVTTRPVKTIP